MCIHFDKYAGKTHGAYCSCDVIILRCPNFNPLWPSDATLVSDGTKPFFEPVLHSPQGDFTGRYVAFIYV